MSSTSSNDVAASAATPIAVPGAALKTAAALLLVLIAGLFAAFHVSDGFRVVTTEDARRLAIAEHPRTLPAALIQYESGAALPLAQALQADGRATIAVFIYTRCNAICSILGSEFQQLQETIRARGLGSQVRLLSISFDERDDQQALAEYARHMRADPASWRFAAVPDRRQRQQLLDAFGITVIPAPLGEFQHNAAFHVIAPDGTLLRIVDYERAEDALAQALAARRIATGTTAATSATARQDGHA